MLQKRGRLFLLVPWKSESHLKMCKNKLSLVTEVWEQKTSSLVEPKWNNFIVKFQNLKHKLLSSKPTKKKINLKNNLKQIKSNFFSRKIWSKSHQNLSTMLLGSWGIWFITWMLATLYTSYHIPKMYRQWDSEHW